MQLSAIRLTKEEQKTKALEVSAAREKIFSLVVKIISWKTEAKDSNSMQNQDKITPDEWKRYEKHLLEISKTESTEAVKQKLKDIFAAIKKHDGFV